MLFLTILSKNQKILWYFPSSSLNVKFLSILSHKIIDKEHESDCTCIYNAKRSKLKSIYFKMSHHNIFIAIQIIFLCFSRVDVAQIVTGDTVENIFGGETVDIADVPYQVALYMWGTFQCGGSILSADWILTAAHCTNFPFVPIEQFSFRGGSSNNVAGGVLIEAKEIHVHPEYDFVDLSNDVSLVRLASPMQGDNIKPVKLAFEGFELNSGSIVAVSGWGRLVN